MNKTTTISLIVGIIVVCVIVIGVAKYQAAQTDNQSQANNSSTNTQNTQQSSAEPVKIEDVVVGEGQEVKVGDTITVHYRGTLADGTQFDSSYDRGEPATFQLAQGALIDGWVEGIPGMKVGGKRKLSIPAAKAYGSRGSGSVPANADLDFEVELVSIGQQ